ncbi:C4-dicarboxylate transporter family protein [[Clostridium] sordellii]|uniref:TDT family transporter n=1 Tax=Paraclostridium sordellii TaxID=1505 RepID=UPI0005DE3A63|nr:TDT family transporter [Paeniclostridium sordellii]CEQ22982.1 C4-dicarboxylate transporter family protein [[Clostridium] sordellii] [Paeniclostridium sordellii]
MNKYLDKLENLHIGISGTCLAFITLSNCWLIKDIGYLKPISIGLAICMLSLMLIRLMKFPKVMFQELKNPVTGTFYPTIGMVTWLVSGYFYHKFPITCSALWIGAVIYHYGIVVFYTIIRIKERNFNNIMPTCFIIYTGMITGSVASKGMGGIIPPIAHFMLMFGFIFYTILLPVVLYIVFKSEILDDKKLPTVGIVCSPAPLGIVGILTIDPNPNIYMLTWLIVTGLILLVVVYSYILKLFKEGFKPAYASFTFPLAIATLAAFKLSIYFNSIGYKTLGSVFELLGNIEIFIATYVVFFILLNFLNMFFKAINPKVGDYLEKEEKLIGGTIYSSNK